MTGSLQERVAGRSGFTGSARDALALRSPLASQVAAALDRAGERARRPVAVTATGPIFLLPGRVRWAPAAVAFERLQELHERAVGTSGPFTLALPRTLTPGQAFHAYSNALVVMLGQVAVMEPRGRAQFTLALADFVAMRGSMAGLEGVLFTAARAVQRAGDKRALTAAAAAAGRVGLPSRLGGGARTAPLLDVATGQLVLVSMAGFQRAGFARGGIAGSAGDVAGLSSSLAGLFSSPHLDPGVGGGEVAGEAADAAQIGAVIGGAIGAIGGAIVGALGGPPGSVGGALAGSLAGAQLGAVAGGVIGLIVGIGVEVETTAPALPGEPRDGGVPGGTGDPGGDGGDGGDGGGSGGGGSGGDGGGSGGGGSGGDGGGSGGGGSDGGGSGGGEPPAPDPGGGGEAGLPGPDDPGGDDGGQVTPARVPAGPGLGGLTTFHGGNSFTINGLPSLGSDGGIRSGGFLSGVAGFGVSDPVSSGDSGSGAGRPTGVGRRGPVTLPSQLVVDPSPDAIADVVLRRLAAGTTGGPVS